VKKNFSFINITAYKWRRPTFGQRKSKAIKLLAHQGRDAKSLSK